MTSSDDLASFIASSFRSVWSLELLLLLKHERRSCTIEEMVTLMRASQAVVTRAIDGLVAAGLVGSEEGGAMYMPVSPEVALLVEETEQLYRLRPDRVRRLIIASSNKGPSAFSDAFRLKD